MNIKLVICTLSLAILTSAGCAYNAIAVTADGHAVITRNDSFLFGALRSVSVCQVTPGGLTACQSNESP